ncbi:hypothetical protein, partial [Haloferula sp.]|uniref:hypothetical protein n=1 Tax=Haloferula sp. TaxID=2497595 RepID=UPI003C749099
AAISLLAVVAIGASLSSCATSNAQIDESVAINAGFKTITPKTAAQTAMLANLPTDQLTPFTHQGKQYYLIPNLAKTEAYVGGPKQLARYESLQVGEAVTDATLSPLALADTGLAWDEWDGWDDWAATGWY